MTPEEYQILERLQGYCRSLEAQNATLQKKVVELEQKTDHLNRAQRVVIEALKSK